ncbi:hypothetical protein WKI72_04770 [Candidatus Erwinia dacicola]|nr:hypothetical protein [Candidatus Erwinia dacicola]
MALTILPNLHHVLRLYLAGLSETGQLCQVGRMYFKMQPTCV